MWENKGKYHNIAYMRIHKIITLGDFLLSKNKTCLKSGIVIGLRWIECFRATLCHYRIDMIIQMENIKSKVIN